MDTKGIVEHSSNDAIIVKIGALSSTILSDPEAALNPPKKIADGATNGAIIDNEPSSSSTSYSLSPLHALLSYYKPVPGEPADKSSRTACLSLAVVFSDILPSHRIVEHSSQERVSKEVRKQRLYENRLLQAYTSYVKRLCGDQGRHAAKALCKLMSAARMFNLSTAVTKEVAARAFKPGADTALSDALRVLFEADVTFDTTLTALGHVRGIFLKLLKKKEKGYKNQR